MATADIRRVFKIGGSMAIVLPCEWARAKVQPGQEVVVVANGELRIIPVHERIAEEKHETEGDSNE